MYVTFGAANDVPIASLAKAGPCGDLRINSGHTSGGVDNIGGLLPLLYA